MIFFSFFLALIIMFLDVFGWTGASSGPRLSFFLLALVLTRLGRAESRAKQLALMSGFLFDLIWPATFGFFLFWHGLIYLFIKKFWQSFLGGRQALALMPLVFITAVIYYLGIDLVRDATWSRAALQTVLLSALLTSLALYALRSLFNQRRRRGY